MQGGSPQVNPRFIRLRLYGREHNQLQGEYISQNIELAVIIQLVDCPIRRKLSVQQEEGKLSEVFWGRNGQHGQHMLSQRLTPEPHKDETIRWADEGRIDDKE